MRRSLLKELKPLNCLSKPFREQIDAAASTLQAADTSAQSDEAENESELKRKNP
jgi:hypothetical protein